MLCVHKLHFFPFFCRVVTFQKEMVWILSYGPHSFNCSRCSVNFHLHAQTCKARNFNGLQALVEKAYMEANSKVGVYDVKDHSLSLIVCCDKLNWFSFLLR